MVQALLDLPDSTHRLRGLNSSLLDPSGTDLSQICDLTAVPGHPCPVALVGSRRMPLKNFVFRVSFFVWLLLAGAAVLVNPQDALDAEGSPADGAVQPAEESRSSQLTLAEAAMCEAIDQMRPVNKGYAFPVSAGQVYCYTLLDPVPTTQWIYHRWYHRDRLSTQIRLKVNPPRWATYSLIRLRETDKGPWRVEISDEHNNLLGTVRFSITD